VAIHALEVGDKVYQFYGVYDGHGGHLAAAYLSNHLHLIVK